MKGRADKVCVVGCGVAGATVGFLLAERGVDVTVVERSPVLGPVGAGVLLQPIGMGVLDRLGLMDTIRTKAEPIRRLHAMTSRGKCLNDLPYNEYAPDCHALGVHRGDLFEVLYQRLLRSTAKVLPGHGLSKCEQTADAVRVFDDQHQLLGEFDYVIAADGAKSLARSEAFPRAFVHEYEFGAIWVSGMCAAIREKLYQKTHGSRELCGILPTGGGRASIFCSATQADYEQVIADGLEQWKQRIIKLCPESEELIAPIQQGGQLMFANYRHVWLNHWHKGRCLLIGDAAHAMSPHLGLGANFALADAECLAQLYDERQDFGDAIARLRGRRIGNVRFYSVLSLVLTPFFQSKGWIKAAGRDIALPLMTHLPRIRGQMIKTMTGLRRGWWDF